MPLQIHGGFMRRIFITIACTLLVVFTVRFDAMACSAPGWGPSTKDVAEADRAFIGLVVKTKPVRFGKYSDMQATTFLLAKSLKGKNPRKFTLKHTTNSGMCGMRFSVGEYYIVAGRPGQGKQIGITNHTAGKVQSDSPYTFKRITRKKWFFW